MRPPTLDLQVRLHLWRVGRNTVSDPFWFDVQKRNRAAIPERSPVPHLPGHEADDKEGDEIALFVQVRPYALAGSIQ
ncbi:hypothetical protein GCM10010136_23650 [Limoniibacter endophyticus]|uniref:Uncharacterized protein n=1 Tax=Limoniibacter endophyticus TaxID=1565040 RepID=A0A8J3DPN8_9HYPH|nr:hypothetical protein GCM10010136_23650 [Limoniibacter endophyticus]